MSNILVIEPRKILQHATAIALFPDHVARILDAIPEAPQAQECDAIIVDAVTLREANALSEQTLRALEEWTVPMVWIDGDPPQAPRCENLVIVKRPVSRDDMRAALAGCLGRALLSKPTTEAAPDQRPGSSGSAGRQKAAAAPAQRKQVIDLVEVVEEPSPDTQGKNKK